MRKIESDIRKKIKEIENNNNHILTGSLSTIVENAPRALMQLQVESQLETLYWILDQKYVSKLKKEK